MERKASFRMLPNEMQDKILSYLPGMDLLAVRLVSSHWKELASPNFSHLTCHLSDDTYPYLSNTTEHLRSICIANLRQDHNKPISSTRGVGRLIGDVESLRLSGDQINLTELQKLMRYARNLKELKYLDVTSPIFVASVNSGKYSFSRVTRLDLAFTGVPTLQQSKSIFVLGELASSSLPAVTHLCVSWLDPTGPIIGTMGPVSMGPVLVAYFITALLVTRFRKSIKSVTIFRGPQLLNHLASLLSVIPFLVNLLNHNPFQVRDLWSLARWNDCVAGLEALKLENVKITLLLVEGTDPFILETILLRKPSLKELHAEKKCGNVPLSTVGNIISPQSLLPLQPPQHLTTVTLAFSHHNGQPLSLDYFSQCSSLKHLSINCFRNMITTRSERVIPVSQLEKLPKSLERLHLKTSPETLAASPDLMDYPILLSRAQMEWLCKGGLPNLRHFGALLILAVNRPEIQILLDEWMRRGNGNPYFPVLPGNVDLDMFKKFLRLPSWKCLELHIVCEDEFMRLPYFVSLIDDIAGVKPFLEAARGEKSIRKVEAKLVVHKFVQVRMLKS